MRKHIGILALAVLVVGSLALNTIAFQVDEHKDIVLIETFGEVTKEIVGRDDPGLNSKWPYPVQKVVRYDGRTSVFEDTGDQASTKDDQLLIVTAYCAWRIGNPREFHRSVNTDDFDEKATTIQNRIRNLLRSAKKDVMGQHAMVDFINTVPEQMKLDEIESEILASVRDQAMADYGVEIVRVGIKSLTLPESVTEQVINAMKKGRERYITSYQQEGEAVATAIEQRARSDRDQIMDFAERKANEIRSEGDQAAARYYTEFKDVEFANFLRIIESLKVELAHKTVFLLDGSGLPHMRWFKDGPNIGSSEKTGVKD